MMLPYPPDIEGRQATRVMFEHYFKQDAAKLKYIPLETQATGDWAYERGNLEVAVTLKSGKPTDESVKYLLILKRQPGGSWKVYR